MIDHLIGRPSPSWKRAQVSLAVISLGHHISVPSQGISGHNLLGVANRRWKP